MAEGLWWLCARAETLMYILLHFAENLQLLGRIYVWWYDGVTPNIIIITFSLVVGNFEALCWYDLNIMGCNVDLTNS